MFKKPIDQISAADLDAFIAEKVPEGKILDYKETIDFSNDPKKQEFLKDVVSFANANGGYILLGVSELRDADGKKTGLPDQVLGLEGASDQTLIQVADIVRMGTVPRVFIAVSQLLSGYPKGPAVVIHIPKSWTGPHMIAPKYNEHRFWSRHGNGKYALDLDEIRTAFPYQRRWRNELRHSEMSGLKL